MLAVSLLLGVLYLLGLRQELLQILEWIEQQGPRAAFLFILLMAAVMVFFIPGVLFTTGTGFVFGIFHGTVCVVLGTTIGAAIAFLIARYLFGEPIEEWPPDTAIVISPVVLPACVPVYAGACRGDARFPRY